MPNVIARIGPARAQAGSAWLVAQHDMAARKGLWQQLHGGKGRFMICQERSRYGDLSGIRGRVNHAGCRT